MAMDFDAENGKTAPAVDNTQAKANAQAQEEFARTPNLGENEHRRFEGAPSVSDDLFYRFSAMSSALSLAASNFIAALTNGLKKADEDAANPLGIEIIKLNSPNETRVVIAKGVAIPFVLAEYCPAYGSCTFMAATQENPKNNDVNNVIRALRKDVKYIHPATVITTADYARGEHFANWTLRVLSVAIEGVKATKRLFRGKHFEIHYSAQEYDAMYEVLCPHAQQLRADIKLTVWVTDNNVDQRRQPDDELALYQKQAQSTCIACIGLYTDFIEQELTDHGDITRKVVMNRPVVYVSDRNYLVPSDSFDYLIAGQLLNQFIQNNFWAMPYTSLADKDVHGNTRDIGNLFLDDKGRPWKCGDFENLRKTLNSSFLKPVMYFCLNEGRALPYGLIRTDSSDEKVVASIIKDISEIVDVDIKYDPSSAIKPVTTREVRYRGFYQFANSQLDSDYIDTLTQTAKTGARSELVRQLGLSKLNVPLPLMTVQRQLEPSVQYYYRTLAQIIDPELLDILSCELAKVVGMNNMNQGTPLVNVGAYANDAERYARYSNPSYTSNVSYYAYDNGFRW